MMSTTRLAALAIPALDTERLSLRGHRLDDFAESAALWGDPIVTRHIGGRPFTEEEVWSRLLRYLGHWALLGFGFWVVREKATGRFVGEVGFAELKRDLEPSFEGAPEAGWVLAPWAHGRGFATEAVQAVLAWGAAQLGAARTVCMIDRENLASIRVAQKCGYREFSRTEYKGTPVILFERS
jgi:RimJ/RimL family protein N-acetyltransferase